MGRPRYYTNISTCIRRGSPTGAHIPLCQIVTADRESLCDERGWDGVRQLTDSGGRGHDARRGRRRTACAFVSDRLAATEEFPS